MITFSGTSYLALDKNGVFLDLVKEGVDRWGANYGGSRRSPLCPEIFTEVEDALADWVGAPAALLTGSGSAAGQLVARYLAQQPRSLHISPMAHPALWWPRGQKHASWSSFTAAIKSEPTIAFTDALDPLSINIPPWEALLAAEAQCLVVDDSHLMGCYGPRYAGSWRLLSGKLTGELIIIASLGKALALPAGVILGEVATLAELKALPQFGGASPPPPAFLHAWLHGQDIISEQRKKLAQNLRLLQPLINDVSGINHLTGFPVLGLTQHEWATRLRQKNIQISAFRYPDEDSPMYSRIVVRADHQREEIDCLIKVLKEITD